MSSMECDALIIGTGVAGLTTAIKLAEAKFNIIIITREAKPETTNTSWAQGGIIYNQESDNQEELIADIMKASSSSSHPEAAQILASRSGKILEEILLGKVETPFTRKENGELELTREAAHSRDRIIYNGDMTGKVIEISLLNYLADNKRFPNVTFLTNYTAIDLITPHHHGIRLSQRYESDKVVGAYVFDQKEKRVRKVLSKFTILATGGIGSLYLNHTNTLGARGDGHAMASRAGAFISNMEFIQFHPTTFYLHSSHRRFLISEAVRGEGGILVNQKGEAFMHEYHHDKDLAPRDVVSRAIVDQMIKQETDCMYLDISFKDPDWIKKRFPTIYSYCLENKIDMAKEPVPVVPAAHYTCGGVKTDLKGRTSLAGLYAVGEVACTGLHGANRLASTSLLEGLTWGYIAAEDIISTKKDFSLYDSKNIKEWDLGTDEVDLALVAQDILTLRQSMWNYVGIIRSRNRLSRARAMFFELQDEVQKFYRNAKLHDELIGLRNATEVAFMVVNASLRNRQSLGCFYRQD